MSGKNFNGLGGFSSIHFNARSLKSNFDAIKDYINSFGITFSVVAVSETWFTSFGDSKAYMIDNYNMFNTSRTNKKAEELL